MEPGIASVNENVPFPAFNGHFATSHNLSVSVMGKIPYLIFATMVPLVTVSAADTLKRTPEVKKR